VARRFRKHPNAQRRSRDADVALSHRPKQSDRPSPAARAEPVEQIDDQADMEQADALEQFENAQAVHSALDELSLPHREALTLHFLQDLSLEQIADVLDVPIGTVKSRLHHAKRALKKILEPEVSP
jgi:RNA polymerase sigma-70 factor (ECF subfamily)